MKLIILIFGTLAAILLSLFFGAADLSASQTLQALMGQGREIDVTIVRELRLPRALLGAVIGAGLGASGAALQGYTRNPLAAPGILGFTSCAALGAVIATGSARFLIITFNTFRNIMMNHKPNIWFVYTHTKSNSSHHHINILH